jgi:uracil-DNA glycosylase
MPDNFDSGPPAHWENLFSQAPLDFHIQHSTQFRTEFGPVHYRGRLDGTARVLLIGQDPSTDEILAQRILVGKAGRLVQGLLKKLGLRSSYLMLNTFLFGITGQYTPSMATLSSSPPILTYRNQLFDQAKASNNLQSIIALGNAAHDAIDKWAGVQGLKVFQ